MEVLKKNKRDRGQGAVEFALALPVILLLVFGLIEFGRLLFVYMAVNNAARDAARYGISIGEGTTAGVPRFIDCDGIKQAALNTGQFAGMEADDITILYDFGPGNPIPKTCTHHQPCFGRVLHVGDTPDCAMVNHHVLGTGVHLHGLRLQYGDRIKISVSVTYTPLLTYMSLDVPTFTMSAFANRTIVKNARVAPAP